MDVQAAYRQFVAALREQADLEDALRLLEWDQATYMPPGAAEDRAQQMATLTRFLHARRTDPAFLALVDELAERQASLTPEQTVDVRETKWRVDRLRRVPADLLAARAQAQATARSLWLVAREQNRFAVLAPQLTEVLQLEREYAAALCDCGDPYTALLEEYEPGLDTELLDELFAALRPHLVRWVDQLRELSARSGRHPRALQGTFPVPEQKKLNRFVAEALGFDFQVGRLDESAHPFSISIGRDHRITTRYDPQDLKSALYSTLHEVGHALYEQGLDPAARGLPRGTACSLGVHESQSRLWENFVGRSEAFWRFLLPHASRVFPQLRGVSLHAVLLEVNEARPSLIRTEADELTYNLHILLRYELERKLVAGELSVVDLPQAWREGMLALFGIAPTDDREGVLQDIHWASGAFGYFPTYTLGNLYAAQFMETADREVGPLSPHIERGNFQQLRSWLEHRIHRLGQRFRAPDLLQHVTGTPPSPRSLIDHLNRRLDWLLRH
jgi:carboxypeptidase Taq